MCGTSWRTDDVISCQMDVLTHLGANCLPWPTQWDDIPRQQSSRSPQPSSPHRWPVTLQVRTPRLPVPGTRNTRRTHPEASVAAAGEAWVTQGEKPSGTRVSAQPWRPLPHQQQVEESAGLRTACCHPPCPSPPEVNQEEGVARSPPLGCATFLFTANPSSSQNDKDKALIQERGLRCCPYQT